MNPMITDVRAAFRGVADRPTSIQIDRTGIPLPYGGHFQGIQKLPRREARGEPRAPDRLIITSSSDFEGYLLACDMTDDGSKGISSTPVRLTPTETVPEVQLYHAGGCQLYGRYLVVGLENPQTKSSSQIQFWDFNKPPFHQVFSMKKDRSGPADVSTAGAVGMTSFESGTVLAVATINSRTIDFYMSTGDPFGGSFLDKKFTWSADAAVTSGWIDENVGSYQNINLVTDVQGNVFMVAFDRSGFSDWMDLYSVDVNAGEASLALKKLDKRHMYCSDGCKFDAGAGIFITSSNGFDVFAVNPKSGDHLHGTTIHVNHFQGI
jgi:hypothetical protein